MFLEKGVITAIRSDKETLAQLDKRLPAVLRKFWVGDQLLLGCDAPSYWQELILIMPGATEIPDMGLPLSPKIIVAPIDTPHPEHYNCYWWERNNTAKSLDNFLKGLNYGDN